MLKQLTTYKNLKKKRIPLEFLWMNLYQSGWDENLDDGIFLIYRLNFKSQHSLMEADKFLGHKTA